MTNEQEKKFQLNRRNFLKVGAVASALGVIGAIQAPAKVADAAGDTLKFTASSKGQWSKLRPEADYGSVSVRFVEYNDQSLGTTKIVGKVSNTSEAEMGFALALRGKLSDPRAKLGMLGGSKEPFQTGMANIVTLLAPDSVVGGKPAPEKLPIPDPEQMSQHIKDAAYFLRADEVGIGKMPKYGYYSEKIISMPALAMGPLDKAMRPITEAEYLENVIVVMVDQHLETMLASTGYDGISVSQSLRSYHATAVIAVALATYIRGLGYNARASHFDNYMAVMPVAIMAAGMGELSRTGDCTIHPRLGFRHKVAAVHTDLPLAPDKPIDFGLQDFCRICMKCADNCPSKAITHDVDPVEHNGYLRWNSDMQKCTQFRILNESGQSCGRCMKVCPWNSKENSWFHQAGTWIGSQNETSAKLLKSIDDMFGYGTEEIQKYKWWLEWPELYKYKEPDMSKLGHVH